jgi:hypothetical protein
MTQKPQSNTDLVREAAVTRRHFDMGCHYMIGEPGRVAMVAMYDRLVTAHAAKQTENVNHELARFEGFTVIADHRRAKAA